MEHILDMVAGGAEILGEVVIEAYLFAAVLVHSREDPFNTVLVLQMKNVFIYPTTAFSGSLSNALRSAMAF